MRDKKMGRRDARHKINGELRCEMKTKWRDKLQDKQKWGDGTQQENKFVRTKMRLK